MADPTASPDQATTQGDSAPSPSAPSDVSSAPSSSATETSGEDTRDALLEAVQQAAPPRSWEHLDGSGGAPPASAAKSGQPADELPDEVSREELERYTPGARTRITRLLDQRRVLQADVERLRGYEPSAQAAQSVTKYLSDNDIGREDFLMGLELMASLRKGDFQRFYAGVQPYMKLAEEYLGISLPPDLQERVRQGHMTTPAAQAFSRERMERAMYQTNLQRQQQAFGQYTQQSQAQQQKMAREHLANQVRDTVNAWESKVAQRDPDYAAKQAAVQDTMWAVVRDRGVPKSPDEAIKVAEESYRRVNERFRAWLPPRRPTSRTPSSTGRTAGVTPEPKTLLEAVQQARQTAPRL
jgi:hypothetical protein